MAPTQPLSEAPTYDKTELYAQLIDHLKKMPQNSGDAEYDSFSAATCLAQLVKGDVNLILHGPIPTGKTVTMLVGVVERAQKLANANPPDPHTIKPKPTGLIVLPTRDQCHKTTALVRTLAQAAATGNAPALRVLAVDRNSPTLANDMTQGAEIIATTTATLRELLKHRCVDWTALSIVGLNDPDAASPHLLADLFGGPQASLLRRNPDTAPRIQLVIATNRATVPESYKHNLTATPAYAAALAPRTSTVSACDGRGDGASAAVARLLLAGVRYTMYGVDGEPSVRGRAGLVGVIAKHMLKRQRQEHPDSTRPVVVAAVWASPRRAARAMRELRDLLPGWDVEMEGACDGDAAALALTEVRISCRRFDGDDGGDNGEGCSGCEPFEIVEEGAGFLDAEAEDAAAAVLPDVLVHVDVAYGTAEASAWQAWVKCTARAAVAAATAAGASAAGGTRLLCHTFFDPRREEEVAVASAMHLMLQHGEERLAVPPGSKDLKNKVLLARKEREEGGGIWAEEGQDDDDDDDDFVVV